MKKLLSLITLLACAGSLYAAGAGTLTPSSVGFESSEGYAADTVISNTLQEAEKTNYQWWSAGSDEGETGTVKLYNVAAEPPAEEGEGDEVAPASETEAGLSKYEYANQNLGAFENIGPGDQYLNVETTTGKPLYRTLATWENNFRWVKTDENGDKVYWTDDGDPAVEEQGTVWQKEYQVNSLADIAGVEIGSEGKVIDTLVQFTASETAPELADGDKLVVWLKQQTEDDKPADWQDQIKVDTKYIYTWTDESEVIQTREYEAALSAEQKVEEGIPAEAVLTETDVMQDNVWPCYTNLMVTAGKLASDGTVVKQDFKVSESVEPDTWYRLTIRAIENVTTYNSKQSGFAIYLDGVAVACMDDDYQTKLLDGFDVANLSSTAKGLYDNEQLFISAVSSTSGASVLTAVGFDGTGKIDDLTINTVEAGPQFAMGTRLFKVEWEKGLTGFTIVAKNSDGNEIENSETQFSNEGGAAGATEFVFADGATTYEISALTFASGSTLSQVSADGAAQTSDNGVYSFTNLQFAPVVTIGVDTILATVGGKEYSSFEDAIAAATNGVVGTTLKLAADVTLNSAISVANGSTLIIDLAGKSIYYTPTVPHDFCTWEPLIHGGDGLDGTMASITVLDSVGGGKIGYTSEAVSMGADQTTYLIDSMLSGYATVTIGTADDEGATFDGMVSLIGGTVYSGKFKYSYNQSDAMLGTVAQGSEGFSMSEDGLYWVVSNAGGETPPETIEYTITISGVDAANATVTVGGNAYDSTATYKYTGTDVVIVATAIDGYTYADVEAAGWTINGTTATYTVSGDITANVTVTVPVALQKADEPEGPTDWDDVDDKTDVSDVVDSTTQTALEGSAVTAKDIKKWAVDHDVDFVSGGISVTPEALMLNCANTAAAIATAKEAFKVDEDIFKDIMANLADLDEVDLSKIEAQYPYATIALEEVTLGEEPSPNAKFFKLKMTLK